MTVLSHEEKRRKCERAEHTRRIRELNDAFRHAFAGGKVTMTAGVDALPDMVKAAALQKAATFDQFNDDNGVNAGAKLHQPAGVRMHHGRALPRRRQALAARMADVLDRAERSSPEAA